MLIITPEDLEPFADIDETKAQLMIGDALALAAVAAPCIRDDDFAYPDAAKAIIRGAILRWDEAGTGAFSSEQVQTGPYGRTVSVDTRTQRRAMFWPSEISELQKLCAESSTGAFTVDTAPAGPYLWHDEACSLHFGAAYCSCGAVLTNDGPLWPNTGPGT